MNEPRSSWRADSVKAFQEFQKGIEDRTLEAPAVTELDQIGSHRLVADSPEH